MNFKVFAYSNVSMEFDLIENCALHTRTHTLDDNPQW